MIILRLLCPCAKREPYWRGLHPALLASTPGRSNALRASRSIGLWSELRVDPMKSVSTNAWLSGQRSALDATLRHFWTWPSWSAASDY